jgi:hypothetical protein
MDALTRLLLGSALEPRSAPAFAAPPAAPAAAVALATPGDLASCGGAWLAAADLGGDAPPAAAPRPAAVVGGFGAARVAAPDLADAGGPDRLADPAAAVPRAALIDAFHGVYVG